MKSVLKTLFIIFGLTFLLYFSNRGFQSYLSVQIMHDFSFPVYTLEEAQNLAGQEDKLIIADYSAIWCPSCRKLSEEIFSAQNISEQIKQDFIYARVDYDSDTGKAFAKKHQLVGFPRVLILRADGQRLEEMPLVFDASEYGANLAKVTERYSQ